MICAGQMEQGETYQTDLRLHSWWMLLKLHLNISDYKFKLNMQEGIHHQYQQQKPANTATTASYTPNLHPGQIHIQTCPFRWIEYGTLDWSCLILIAFSTHASCGQIHDPSLSSASNSTRPELSIVCGLKVLSWDAHVLLQISTCHYY